MTKESIPELFGSMVFNDAVMKERLSEEVYKAVRRTMDEGRSLSAETAASVAEAMRDWAVELGATHFTHWFQPLTGITAEKHDSFISPAGNGRVIMDFSGKELILGESDASSLPSGGLRATFEARGYTAWDPTSYAFIKDRTLYIPTAFCSYGGDALDMKTPLLRSMEALNRQALRILKLFGHEDVTQVKANVGPEQEYFLVDAELAGRRPDLIYTGHTLFGAKPPKGQEMSDHYFGNIPPRVAAFMRELDTELWKLGIYAKTEHNESAPAQHELAPIYTTATIATDHNQLTMEMMKKVAAKHGMLCLLDEKPFAGVNGSGKHNNWSLQTNTGMNLFNPGETPYDNAQFLLFLCAVMQAVDDYQDMLRLSVATAGNDRRLGGDEAPPCIISIYVGDELFDILTAIENDTAYDAHAQSLLRVGVHTLPRFTKDSSDRNRTSPFAFTGNKFEFRMPGSSASVASCNIVLNTAMAESLRLFADELEGADDFDTALHNLIQRTIKSHKRILWNGNGYDDAWAKEAVRERGLLNLRTTPDALPCYLDAKNIAMFQTHRVLSETEIRSRYEILNDNYSKLVRIEALTLIDMVSKDILPAATAFMRDTAEAATAKKAMLPSVSNLYEESVVSRVSVLSSLLYKKTGALRSALDTVKGSDSHKIACYYRDRVLSVMAEMRELIDELESRVGAKYWPFPTYAELLFSIR